MNTIKLFILGQNSITMICLIATMIVFNVAIILGKLRTLKIKPTSNLSERLFSVVRAVFADYRKKTTLTGKISFSVQYS